MAASDRPHLESNQMGVADIVFFVLALIAPVGVVVSLTTLSIAFGAGAGTPGVYVIAGVALALFAVGYVRMSRRITNAGAFYAYISRGLGRTAGTAAAYVAVVAYNAAAIGVLGALAFSPTCRSATCWASICRGSCGRSSPSPSSLCSPTSRSP
jgi:amino acid transporter